MEIRKSNIYSRNSIYSDAVKNVTANKSDQ